MKDFRAGFVNILGFPNVGKSTLLNKLIGEKISIVSPKVQTTRQRINGILSGKGYQIVFSDTPGILKPQYELQKSMAKDIDQAFTDGDLILYVTEAKEDTEKHKPYLERLKKSGIRFLFLINKIDLLNQEVLEKEIEKWAEFVERQKIVPIAALHDFNVANIIKLIAENLPIHEPYYPEDMLTDKSEKYIASEIIREKIFNRYRQEIPYSTEVIISSFKEEEDIIRMSAEIIVSRKSQKPILIGKQGKALKMIGMDARQEMEVFFDKKIFLELFVKVRENWRDKKIFLKQYGYNTD
jgi:GTP-binding protein Era